MGLWPLREVILGNADLMVPHSGERQWSNYVDCNHLHGHTHWIELQWSSSGLLESFLGTVGVTGSTPLFYVMPHTDPMEPLLEMTESF